MNLDFGILWIEDSFNKEEEEDLRQRVAESGFIARIDTTSDGATLDSYARNNQLYHLYDLILLDLRLSGGASGVDLAPKIRQLFPATTILLYSGSVDSEQDLRRLIADKEVEGVYCSKRERFIQRAGSLIDQTAQSLNRLSGMRGLAVRVVAECDQLMKEAVLLLSARDPSYASMVGELDRDVTDHLQKSLTDYTETMKGDLPARFKNHSIDSGKLHSHFRRLIKEVTKTQNLLGLEPQQIVELRAFHKQTAQYAVTVLKTRNVLGHVMEEKSATGWVLKDSEISVAEFAELRKSFAAHIQAFRRILELLTPQQP